MTIDKIQTENKLTLALDGRLDTSSAPALQDVLITAFDESNHIELDFSKIAYVASAGLRVLLMGQKAAKAKNAEMTLSGVSEEVAEVFDMTGFSDILTVI